MLLSPFASAPALSSHGVATALEEKMDHELADDGRSTRSSSTSSAPARRLADARRLLQLEGRALGRPAVSVGK
jgi:hypothetical protein